MKPKKKPVKSVPSKVKEVKKVKLKVCPFCCGDAIESSSYDSDDNSPDGHQFYIECDSCGATGSKFYAVTTNESNIRNRKHIIEQREFIANAMAGAVKAWNTRLEFTGYYDDNGNKIFVGDKLESEYDYCVTVYKENNKYFCKLICKATHTAKNIPYALNKGKGYVKIFNDEK